MSKNFSAKRMASIVFCLSIAVGSFGSVHAQGLPSVKSLVRPNVTISGPYKKDNLTIFLLHGKDSIKGKNFLTLQEGLAQKKVVVYETGDVNELAVENLSNELVFIQSGEIVKGGRQDRTFQYDMILPPHSGKQPIKAFCVEHGRWSQRGEESAAHFTASPAALPTPSLKIAAHAAGDQNQVWNKVEEAQRQIASRVYAGAGAIAAGGAAAASQRLVAKASPTSLQLALENKDLQKLAADRAAALEKVIDSQKDVIGFACAINGKITSADVYASNALFKKLWPKLLTASAIESISDEKKGQQFKPADARSVDSFMSRPAKEKVIGRDINARVGELKQESSDNVMFETIDHGQSDAWVHQNYLAK
jgi:hypothetical protein